MGLKRVEETPPLLKVADMKDKQVGILEHCPEQPASKGHLVMCRVTDGLGRTLINMVTGDTWTGVGTTVGAWQVKPLTVGQKVTMEVTA